MSQTAFQIGKLRCTAGRGMFAHEAGVSIRGSDRCYESMIDSDLVAIQDGQILGDDDVPALVMVTIVKTNGSKMLVELPRQVVAGGRRIWVSKSEVQT